MQRESDGESVLISDGHRRESGRHMKKTRLSRKTEGATTNTILSHVTSTDVKAVDSLTAICALFPVELGSLEAVALAAAVAPGGQITFYLSGTPGARVSIAVNRVQNSGGHLHAGGPSGSISPQSLVLGPKYPQNQTAVFTAPIASGSVQVTANFSPGNPPTITAMVNVAVPGLVELTGGVGITLTGASPTHPKNHYGLPALISKIQQLAAVFHNKFGKNLFVNDMSLPDGGLYDFKNTFAPPHATHREGRTVDINSTSMSQAERDFFRTTALGLGFAVTLETNPEHWHLGI
jgi:hypothetical protein